jgi:2-keto-4-pentenoate hydratase/2-oxohepta-3-ene-1,7-dioic acid hydratase in catechol pathway
MRKYKFKNGKELEVKTMFCVGQNYAKHAAEMGGQVATDPIIFIKPPQAYIENGGKIILPDMSKNIHHEVELVVVIGKECKNISEDDAINYIAGYAVGIDVTMRDVQKQSKDNGLPWAVAKGFYGSAPISEIIPAENFGDQIPFFDLSLKVNNQLRQNSSTQYMERSVAKLIEYLSRVFTLEPGDCIFTGTPEGVGQIVNGDILFAELNNYVALSVECVAQNSFF